MRRAQPPVVVGLVVLLVVSGIAAAAHTQAVSQHDTTSDFASATALENVSVDSGSVTFPDGVREQRWDGFEDGDISEWSGDTSKFSASTGAAHSGTFALKHSNTRESLQRLTRSVSARQPATVSVWHYQDTLKDIGRVAWTNGGGQPGDEGPSIEVHDDGSVHVRQSLTNVPDTGIDVTAGEWYQLEADIDWAANTYDLTVRDDSGTVIGTYTGASFRNNIADIDGLKVRSTGGVRYWDDFGYGSTKQTGSYTSQPHQLSNVQTGYVDLATVRDARAQITWQGRQGGGWTDVATQTVTTAGNYTTDLSTEQYAEWRVRVDMTTTGFDPQVTLTTEGVAAATAAPSVANAAASPQGNPTLTSAPTLSIPVADADFATTQGDTVDVTFRADGTPIETISINSNQTVEYQPDTVTGTTDWSVEVTDSYGHTVTSNTFTFTVPSALTVANVSEPRTKLTSGEIEVRLFQEGSDTVFERTASGGDIALQGVDADANYFVKADAPGYYERRTLLTGIFEQRGIYLLNKSAPAATVAFQIEDRTGNFGAGSTIQLERALNTSDTPSGESRYQVVAGAELGSKREFVTTLEKRVRYRVIVQSDTGQERQLGAFTIQQDSRRIDLLISGIDQSFTTTSGPVVNTTQTISGSGATRSKTVTFRYVDPTNQTDALTLRVHEAGNPSNVFATTSASPGATPLGTFQYSRTFSGRAANTSLVANYTVERNGATEQATQPFGADRYPVNLPLGDGWAQIFGVGLLLVVGGIFSVANARIGALVLPAVGYVLIVIGVLDGVIALTSVGVAFAVAVGVNLARGDGGGV